VDRRLTCSGLRPGFPTRLFTHCYHCPVPCSLQYDTFHVYTLLSLPSAMHPSARYLPCLHTAITAQCHAAFSMIPSMFTHCYHCPVPCTLQHDTFHVYTLLSLPSAMQPSARYLPCLHTAITAQCLAAFSMIPSMFTHCYHCPVPCSLQHDNFHVYTLLSLPSAMQPSA